MSQNQTATTEAAVAFDEATENASVRVSLNKIYGGLKSCRDAYNECVNLFRGVQRLDAKLGEVTKFSMPTELVDKRIENDILDTELSDEGFVDVLENYCKANSNVARLAVLERAIAKMVRGREDLARKEAKLSERIKLSENHSPEYMASIKRRQAVQFGIRVLDSRVSLVDGMFFKTLHRVMTSTRKSLDALYKRQSDGKKASPALVAASIKYGVRDEAYGIVKTIEAARESGIAAETRGAKGVR